MPDHEPQPKATGRPAAPRVRFGLAAAWLAAAELVVGPLLSRCLSPLPGRPRSPAETLATVAAFYGLQRLGGELGFRMGPRNRLANWRFAAARVREDAWRIRLGSWAALALVWWLLRRRAAAGVAAAALWCAAGGWFMAGRLFTWPVDKALWRVGPWPVAALSLAGLALYAAALLYALPLRAGQRRAAAQAAGVFAAAFFVYHLNLRTLGSGDTFAAPYVSVSLLRSGDFNLDEFAWIQGKYQSLHPRDYGVVRARVGVVSKYPPWSSVLAAPVFAPFFFVPWLSVPDNEFMLMYVGKLAATLFAACSAAAVFLLLRRFAGPGAAAALALLYALGTCVWFVSQALWQHPACLMALAWALYFLATSRRRPGRLTAAGAALAAALAARYASFGLVAALAAYAAWEHRRAAWRLLLGAAPVAAFQLLYNWRCFGAPWRQSYQSEAWSAWTTPLLHGLAGHLVSPSRGLFVSSPFLLFAAVGLAAAWRRRRRCAGARLALAAGLAAAAQVCVMSKWNPWHGGLSYGYRMIVDACPLLMIPLAWGLPALWKSRVARTAFVLAAVWSVGVQTVGAFGFDGSWERAFARAPRRYWLVRHSQIPFYVFRNRWYVLKLKREPVLRLAQRGVQITLDGLVEDPSLDYPRILVLEPARVEFRKPPPR